MKRVNQHTALPMPQRFEDKFHTEPNSGCWIWLGSLDSGGYGMFKDQGKNKKAHRVSFELYRNVLPQGPTGRTLECDHLCRTRCCVNPDHLELVTRIVNVRRGVRPEQTSAQHQAQTHCLRGHEFTPENTYYSRMKKGYLHRDCRQCKAAYQRNRRRKIINTKGGAR